MLSRSGKILPLALTIASAATAMAAFASPASAFSLNPDAASPGIEKINTFHWIIFVVTVIAIVIVNLAILRAAKPRHRHVQSESTGGGRQMRVGFGLGVVALALFVTATVFSSQAREVPVGSSEVAGLNADDQLEIRVTGQQWLWRYDYPNTAFSYHRLVVPVDTTVALNLVSADVIHGWNVPALTGKAQAVPGKTNSLYFRADREGVFTGQASVLSGQSYDTMQSEVAVVSLAKYEAFVQRLRAAIQEAQDSVVATQQKELREAAEETPTGEVEPQP
ncbi:MAG: cytochrome c oxidase subunit II [Solirubrobacterales bacterium]